MAGLRELAEKDLGAILEDGVAGFGWPITVTSPDGTVGNLTGFSNDISQIIDPDTGQPVSGRAASVALRITALALAGLTIPVSIADTTGQPWRIEFNDINGNPYQFKVAQSNPDRALGLVTCLLEAYI